MITFRKGYRTKSNGNTCHLRTNSITMKIKRAFGIIIKERPYVLRSYFDTQLLFAESKGNITHTYRQFFMGHKGDIEARYTTNKGKIPEHLIQDMCEAYERSQNFLSPFGDDEQTVKEKNKKEFFLEMWQEQAKVFGINPMALKIEQQRDATVDDKICTIKDAILKKFQANQQQLEENQYESKVVNGEDELLSYIENGWHIVKELSNGKVILRRNRIIASG